MAPRTEFTFDTREPRETVRLRCDFSPHIVRVEKEVGPDDWEEYTWAGVRLERHTVVLVSLPRGRFRVVILGINEPKEFL